MKELIDKSAVVAEIAKRIKKYASIDVGGNEIYEALYGAKCKALIEILRFLDTLEVKEVDLEKEYEEYVVDDPILNVFIQNDVMGMKVAKHFCELGIKAQKGE